MCPCVSSASVCKPFKLSMCILISVYEEFEPPVPLNTTPGEYRLPGDVYPVSYAVHLHPVLGPDQFYFTGNVSIKLRVIMSTERLVLHAVLHQVGLGRA